MPSRLKLADTGNYGRRSKRRCPIRLQRYVGVPAHLVAYSDRAGGEYLRVDPAAPTLPHRSLESGNCLIHLLAGAGLSCDAKARRADAEYSSAAVLEVDSIALATSGEYRRGAHIVDGRTGMRPTGSRSVSCVARDLATADVLATAGFAMGAEALEWLAAWDGVEAMVVGDDDLIRWTPGFRSLLATTA